MLIAEAIPTTTPESDKPNLIGVYLSQSRPFEGAGEIEDIMEYISVMTPAEPVPRTKLLVYPPKNGVYPAWHGPIINPVEGDYSTGGIDPDNIRQFNCNPEPVHCRWKYWDSVYTKDANGDSWPLPRYHCLQVFGEWWITEVHRSGLVHQVASLEFADNPNHNYGIHDDDHTSYVNRMGDEVSKVLQENNFEETRLNVDRSRRPDIGI